MLRKALAWVGGDCCAGVPVMLALLGLISVGLAAAAFVDLSPDVEEDGVSADAGAGGTATDGSGYMSLDDMLNEDLQTAGETIMGDSGSDILIGGDGDDQLIGDTGDDVLRGGRGNDVLLVDPEQLFRIERRRRLIHVGNIEELYHLFEAEHLLVTV